MQIMTKFSVDSRVGVKLMWKVKNIMNSTVNLQ